MFTTVEEVTELTGYLVPLERIRIAQGLIEGYVGRVEAEVTNPNDRAMLAKATAYQVAYMGENYEDVFEQIAVRSMGQNDSLTVFEPGNETAPFIAPLAILVLKHLTFGRSRSIKTGPIARRVMVEAWERT